MFERLRRLTGLADGESGAYECQACTASYAVQRQVCPECGGYHIDRDDW